MSAEHCARCGRMVWWDSKDARISPYPMCVTCWDAVNDQKRINRENSAYMRVVPPQRRYRNEP